MPARSGGGIQGKNVVQTSNPKVEPTVNNISPNRPSMIGLKHYQESAKGPLYQSSKSTTPYGRLPIRDTTGEADGLRSKLVQIIERKRHG